MMGDIPEVLMTLPPAWARHPRAGWCSRGPGRGELARQSACGSNYCLCPSSIWWRWSRLWRLCCMLEPETYSVTGLDTTPILYSESGLSSEVACHRRLDLRWINTNSSLKNGLTNRWPVTGGGLFGRFDCRLHQHIFLFNVRLMLISGSRMWGSCWWNCVKILKA